jgi:hypothetical protein
MNVSEWWSSVMVRSLLWRRNSCVSCALIPAPGISPGRCDDSKEHFSMSRIAKGLALTSVAAAAVAGTAGIAAADSGATGSAAQSPGVLSGNVLQVPIHVPVNVCGNTVNVIGLLNPAFGNTCANG